MIPVMKVICTSLPVVLVGLLSLGDISSAHAGGTALTGRLDLLPIGTLSVDGGGQSEDIDAAVTFGVGAVLDTEVAPKFRIGIAPRIIIGVKPDEEDDGDDATEIDVAVRGTYVHEIDPLTRAYGFGALGYSVLLFPEDNSGIDDPAGLVVGFGGGVMYDLNETTFIGGELGYQLGFQSTSFMGQDVTISASYLHLGASGGLRF
jgi:hypothetical protein